MADREPPTLAEARTLFLELDRLLAERQVVAVHCLAGLGRTGTVLAGYLVHTGCEPLHALERVRALRPRSVQTAAQAEFLTAYARAVGGEARSASSMPGSAIERR